MINIYTSLNYFKDDEIIVDNESFFKNISIVELSSDFLDIMRKIDRAVLIDKRTGKMETPYGVCNIWDLSTGCKTAINILYVYRYNKYPTIKAINVTECGANALEEIFEIAERFNIDIKLVLEHNDFTSRCKERNYIINGEHKINQLGFIGAYR